MAAAAISWTLQISGTIISPKTSSLIVYDSDGTTELRSLDWGQMEQGKTYLHSIIVKNTGNTKLTLHLNLPNDAWTTGDWGKVSWDLEDSVLDPGQDIHGTLTWAISSTAPLGSTGAINIGIEGTET
jgi:hypothetical protein